MRAMSLALLSTVTSVAAIIALEIISPSVIVDYEVTGVQFEARHLREAVLSYKSSTGSLPSSLDQLVSAGVVRRIPTDRWNSKYIYRRVDSGEGFVLYSPGKDTIDQAGGGDDIVTGEKVYECGVYGVNCPLPIVERVRIASLLAFAVSVAGLLSILALRLFRLALRRNAT